MAGGEKVNKYSTGQASSNTSCLPSTLVNNVTALTFAETNGNYNLIVTGTVNALGSLTAYPANRTKIGPALATPGLNFSIAGVRLSTGRQQSGICWQEAGRHLPLSRASA
ncbi:MAG: hypothetical protein WCK34_17025 [Bacteroidota bacterium]